MQCSFRGLFLSRSVHRAIAKGVPICKRGKINRLKRKYGHDLSKLIIESRRRKLGRAVKFTRNHLAAVKLLSAPYSQKLLEYSEVGTYTLPHYWVVCDVASGLVHGLRSYCYRATFNKELPISHIRKLELFNLGMLLSSRRSLKRSSTKFRMYKLENQWYTQSCKK